MLLGSSGTLVLSLANAVVLLIVFSSVFVSWQHGPLLRTLDLFAEVLGFKSLRTPDHLLKVPNSTLLTSHAL